MTLAFWKELVERYGAVDAVKYARGSRISVPVLACMTDRSRLSKAQKEAVSQALAQMELEDCCN